MKLRSVPMMLGLIMLGLAGLAFYKFMNAQQSKIPYVTQDGKPIPPAVRERIEILQRENEHKPALKQEASAPSEINEKPVTLSDLAWGRHRKEAGAKKTTVEESIPTDIGGASASREHSIPSEPLPPHVQQTMIEAKLKHCAEKGLTDPSCPQYQKK